MTGSGGAHTEVHALASGSSGNAVLVAHGGAALLLDAGVGVRALTEALKRLGIAPSALQGILLTHEHHDHVNGAFRLSARSSAPLVANRATLDAAALRGEVNAHLELATGGEARLGPFTVRSFAVPHDAAEPVGYVVRCGRHTICHATDVGSVNSDLRSAMLEANLCVVEANHDVEWLKRGPYPPLMKRRILGDRGHLSNEDCARVIAERVDCGGPAHFWLAHLSRVNNSPSLALKYVRRRVAELTHGSAALEVALRDRPSVTWRSGGPLQLSLFGPEALGGKTGVFTS